MASKREKILGEGNDISFFSFIRRKEQKNKLLFITVFYLIVYFVLIYLYPFPDGISDSGGYVLSALENQYLGYRPFGYSKFLIKLHGISTSISFVVFVQYWLNAICTVFFIFTIKYLFRPKNKMLEFIFEFFSICSVSTIYMTNCILSDSLFSSLTILWIAFSIWLIATPKTHYKTLFFFIQVVLLGILLTVRYTGFIYSGIALVIVFITFFQKSKFKMLGFSAVIIILVSTIYFNQIKTTTVVTGIKSFSGFSGWQMANNVLHVLPHIQLDTSQIVNQEVKKFSHFAEQHDTLIKCPKYSTTPVFMWDSKMPLKKYLYTQINEKKTVYLTEYTYLGENVYSKFAAHIIKKHPLAYIRYFIIPNMCGVVYPRYDDVLIQYKANVIPQDLLQKWFEIDTETKFYSRSEIIGKIARFLPEFKLVLLILTVIAVVLTGRKLNTLKWSPVQNKTYWILVFFIIIYMGFHSYAAPFMLRFSIALHLPQIAILYLALNYVKNISRAHSGKFT